MTLVNGSWVIQEGGDFWKCLPKPPVGSHNFCRDIVAVGSVVYLAVDPAEFVGVFRRGPDVQVITSDSSCSSSSSQPDSISSNDSFSQCNLDTALTSPNPGISTDSRIFFTTDDIPLVDATTDDQIFMPSVALPAPDFTESFSQLRASVTQLLIKQLRTNNSIGDLKNHILSKIDHIAKAFADAHTQQDQVLRGLFKNVRQEVQIQKTALSLEFLESKRESLLIISIEVVMSKKGKEVAAEVRSLLRMIVADLVLVMKVADLAEVVGATLRVKDITEVVDLTKDLEEALDTG
ncbi:hypothetical protein F511_24521 [Dorcoceras hygrometricum]|uniref:Uncharacterized protein n=1 Tax=Dorcoceras hygrometricum TaxID=472368 RepID=A0A2Z7B481_9LAMI|nr:hypothetical protein F511_24521 [Dorcoceras hygrometricum]